MKNSDIKDPLFLQAVEAIDAGNIYTLQNLLVQHPQLVYERLNYPNEGYFKHPYLLWFVADNPIRVDKLPSKILEVCRLLIQTVKREAKDSAQEQLDYTLGLVVTGRISRESGVQIDMIDLLIDEGAKPGEGIGALAHGNIAAAEHLIQRGSSMTLATAVGLDRMEDVKRLALTANKDEQFTALTVAAFYGMTSIISFLLGMGVEPNGYPKKESGFHMHATPLHQAVFSGSIESVKLLVKAGAKLDAKDKVYGGTPLGWAKHMPAEEGCDEASKRKFDIIADYLQNRV